MNKIIIHNQTEFSDVVCLCFIQNVIGLGLISGSKEKGTEQYCYITTYSYEGKKVFVSCLRKKETYTFKVFIDERNIT